MWCGRAEWDKSLAREDYLDISGEDSGRRGLNWVWVWV